MSGYKPARDLTDAETWELARESMDAEAFGLLDPGQPTPWAHYKYLRRMEADFTPMERRLIRSALGLDTEDDHE
jgi:hypothetical protein